MATQASNSSRRETKSLRLIVAILLVAVCAFKLFLTFRGLDQPAAMDQAQIARHVAKGEGFVTDVLRPLEVMNAAAANKRKKIDERDPSFLTTLRDSTYAPLNISAMAVALKIFGAEDFNNYRLGEGDGVLYTPDRIVAGTSMFFFLLAVVLTYVLVARLFDEVVACVTSCFMLLSDVLLQYSVSGLSQPLMMCCFLGTLLAMLSACRRYKEGYLSRALVWLGVAFVCAGLMCLSGWMALWPVAGLLVFCSLYFRPSGSYSLVAVSILVVLLGFSAVMNYLESGSVLGNAMLGLYNCFGNGESTVLRSATLDGHPLKSEGFVLNFLSHTFSQLRGMYVNMGSIIVVPFFLLALLHPFRRSEVRAMKLIVFSMWAFACMGMALFGVDAPVHTSQLAVLFTPVFTAFGTALLFNFLSRNKLEGVTFNQLRGLAVFIMVLVSAGPFLAGVSGEIYRGAWGANRLHPHYPPYYPPVLNGRLSDISNPQQAIMTDQPWAVAWYANRKAMWLPLSTTEFEEMIEPAMLEGGLPVQGILITPSSHSPIAEEYSDAPGGISTIINTMGDFAPLALEGKILQIVPRHNVALADLFIENTSVDSRNVPMGKLVSSRGRFSQRVPLLGADVMYYTLPQVAN